MNLEVSEGMIEIWIKQGNLLCIRPLGSSQPFYGNIISNVDQRLILYNQDRRTVQNYDLQEVEIKPCSPTYLV
ncbi:hypothetical protein P364_0114480 [Paenibacillus sp. MAEPY2]|nr:hypothetical protein P363_0128225 [Paenibacillus sp. MAEPY1]KGP82015.1 hypothetical protein P364_0114480 [Paenibacillus sp. MAEPY2]